MWTFEGTIFGLFEGLLFLATETLPLVVGLALLAFFFGLARFILAGGDEDNIAAGKRIIFWGIIALFIIAAMGGIITLIQDIFFGEIPTSNVPLKYNP
jgi:ribose/xylose/arabinose/galactoside ABC-type transport system permease subunit